MIPHSKKKALAGIGLLASALTVHLSSPAEAWDLPAGLEKAFLGEVTKGKASTELPVSESPDNSIDPAVYKVGGGDGFQISIKDLPSQEYFPVVNPDGSLYLGDFGEIEIGGVTLNQAKQLIRDRMRKALKRNYDVYVTLKKVKKVSVTAGGSLPQAGSYQLPGTSRLFDVVKLANHNQSPSLEKFDLRQVTVRNGDSIRTYDLLRFLGAGDAGQNPYLYPGDHVVVKPLDRSITVVGHVLGPVKGRIPIVPGERLSDLLLLLSLKSSADSAYFLVHGEGGTRRIEAAGAADVLLRENDVITIPSLANFGSQDTVLVTGEVERPGTYPIEWGRTRASDLLAMAGGPTQEGNPGRAFLVRRGKLPQKSGSEPDQALSAWMRQGAAAGSMVRPEMRVSLSDLVSTNDYALLELPDPASVLLEGGDEIHVPRVERYVYVSGQVRKPGAYPFSRNRDREYYIDLAGGYSSKADTKNGFVLFRYQDITALREEAKVGEGDIVVVPPSVENKRLTTLYLPVFQAVATVLSLALTIIAISK